MVEIKDLVKREATMFSMVTSSWIWVNDGDVAEGNLPKHGPEETGKRLFQTDTEKSKQLVF